MENAYVSYKVHFLPQNDRLPFSLLSISQEVFPTVIVCLFKCQNLQDPFRKFKIYEI